MEDQSFEVFVSPYSLGCDVTAKLVVVSTPQELEKADCKGKLLLLRGPISSEQLMPKKFVFYNPEHHKKIIALLENKNTSRDHRRNIKAARSGGCAVSFSTICGWGL